MHTIHVTNSIVSRFRQAAKKVPTIKALAFLSLKTDENLVRQLFYQILEQPVKTPQLCQPIT